MKKNILAIQMNSVIGEVEENFKKAEFFIDNFFQLNNKKPDFVVLPEVWTVGWCCSVFRQNADEIGLTEKFLSEIAKKHDVNIIGGSYIRKEKDVFKNTCPVINKKGEVIARYEKIHLYAPDGEAEAVQPGETPVIVDIEGVKTGLSICYDIRFPELYRSYINSSFAPELMINMSAWPKTRKEQYTSMASSRAIENQCYFLALSQTGIIKDDICNSGNSLLVEPMGEIVQKLDENEGYIFASLDFDKVKEVRRIYPNLGNRKVYDFGLKPQIFGAEVNV